MDGEVSPAELERLLESDEPPVVVDIRTQMAFERGHIPGSRNIPFAVFPREVEQLRGESHVVTVCPHGKASVQAARLLTSFEGFDGRVESLERGLSGWDGPLEREVEERDDSRAAERDDPPAAPF